MFSFGSIQYYAQCSIYLVPEHDSDRTEILLSQGLSVSFRAEGHDKRDTAFHVLSRQTFVEL